ncbi:MAG: hypothetical protein HRT58_22140 [Crocinitomicaceae bacterium]|nr:hypothetical protein [Flavobacteriales bacterium]NQZ38377.1 hypothetical protein [Crocinitomicaceae bacterium]
MREDIETVIIDKLSSIKKNLKHDKICFSGIENNFRDKKGGSWKQSILLSIILAEHKLKEMDSDLEMISEVVIEVVVLNESDIIDITMDIYYGNGIIIKEVILKDVDFRNRKNALINELDALFFRSVENDIYNALELLIPARE